MDWQWSNVHRKCSTWWKHQLVSCDDVLYFTKWIVSIIIQKSWTYFLQPRCWVSQNNIFCSVIQKILSYLEAVFAALFPHHSKSGCSLFLFPRMHYRTWTSVCPCRPTSGYLTATWRSCSWAAPPSISLWVDVRVGLHWWEASVGIIAVGHVCDKQITLNCCKERLFFVFVFFLQKKITAWSFRLSLCNAPSSLPTSENVQRIRQKWRGIAARQGGALE